MVAKSKLSDIQFSEDTRLALLEQSIDHLNATLMRFETRFDQIDAKFNQMDGKFNQMDGKFNQMDVKFGQMDVKFGQMDAKFEKLDSRIDSNFKWLLSIMIAGFGSVLGIIAHVQHWI